MVTKAPFTSPFQAALPQRSVTGASRLLPTATNYNSTKRDVPMGFAAGPGTSGAAAAFAQPPKAPAFKAPPSELGGTPFASNLSPAVNAAGAAKAGTPPRAGAGSGTSLQPPPPPLQAPGNNFTNPGLTEQALTSTQNRLLEDPFSSAFQNGVKQAGTPSQGENYMNQNLGTLDGPGEGDQYWNQVQGQFNQPFAGEQFARQATQNMAPTGPAGAFFNQAQQQYGDFTGFQGPQNAQGQFQQNAQSGPLAGQQFFNQVQGQAGTTGRYSDPNLAAGQYAQTQQAFGDLPVAEFDPFYDRARQLGVQSYNRDAAGRGVYGSSEALSGVGNVITDIEAQRANRSFDAEMQRSQEQRMRQGLLGEQARAGDLSSIAGFGANLAGLETFGNLANMAGNQTLGQQTMLGNQANQADTQALGAQNANLEGLSTFGNLSQNADSAETNRFNARTGAMNDADRTGISRFQTGADIAFRGDENARQDFTASNNAANNAAGLNIERTRLGADIADRGSDNDLNRLDSFNNAAGGAEDDRQARNRTALDAMAGYTKQVQDAVSGAISEAQAGEYQSSQDAFEAMVLPALQEAGYDQQKIDALRKDFELLYKTSSNLAD